MSIVHNTGNQSPRMNIYLLTRWGNGTDDDGPDSSNDTHSIVRAESLQRANEISERLLLKLPVSTSSVRKVALFNHYAALIGTSMNPVEGEGVICNCWYGFLPLQNCATVWKRDSKSDAWQSFEEYHGEPPPFNEFTG